MVTTGLRKVVIVCAMAGVSLGMPAKSWALFDWLCPWHHRPAGAAVTTYTPPAPLMAQPVVFAPRYNPVQVAMPVATQQSCCYIPQTAYRTVMRPVLTTVMSPIQGCDPCTGCPVTTYRPVTTYAYRALSVPYTTYRMVCSNPCATQCAAPCATGCASGCGTTFGGMSPITSGAGCSSCVAPPAVSSPIMSPSSSGSSIAPIPSSPADVRPSLQLGTVPAPSGTYAPPAGASSDPIRSTTNSPVVNSPVVREEPARPNMSPVPVPAPAVKSNTIMPNSNTQPPKLPSWAIPGKGRITSSLTVPIVRTSYRETYTADAPARPVVSPESKPFRPGVDLWSPSDRQGR